MAKTLRISTRVLTDPSLAAILVNEREITSLRARM
jgi:hypothetical protein